MVCGKYTDYHVVECAKCTVDKQAKEINLQMQSGKLSVSFQLNVIKTNFLGEYLLPKKCHT